MSYAEPIADAVGGGDTQYACTFSPEIGLRIYRAGNLNYMVATAVSAELAPLAGLALPAGPGTHGVRAVMMFSAAVIDPMVAAASRALPREAVGFLAGMAIPRNCSCRSSTSGTTATFS